MKIIVGHLIEVEVEESLIGREVPRREDAVDHDRFHLIERCVSCLGLQAP
jgi:hypothetical protein